MNNKFHLTDGYKFKGFITKQRILGIEFEPDARVIELKRIQKKAYVELAVNII
jgi:hypothetical protein